MGRQQEADFFRRDLGYDDGAPTGQRSGSGKRQQYQQLVHCYMERLGICHLGLCQWTKSERRQFM
jgi:hypothetical protein